MKRVRYLAALGGGAAQRTVPALQPPRRLFPHEPLRAAAPSPPAQQPAAAIVRPTPPAPATDAEPAILPAAPAHIERVSAEAGKRPAPAAPTESPVLRPTDRAVETHDAPPPQLQITRAQLRPEPQPVQARALAPRPRARGSDPPSPPRADERGIEPEPPEEHVPVARQTRTALAPPRRRPEAPSAAASRPPAGASQVHIGTIEVTVVPPPPPPAAAPGALPQRRPAAPQASPSIAPRVGSAGRWFGLAQR